MSHLENLYSLEELKSFHDLKFFFISSGIANVVKAIHYAFVLPLDGVNVFNLGFGDYDIKADKIIDQVDTNNGDVYKVFNTVLSTIPIFFKYYDNTYLIVAGSDGRPDFMKNCKPTCNRNCGEECRKFNRRINIYRSYVDKHIDKLTADYEFLGGLQNEFGQIELEPYIKFKKYDSVLLSKRKS